MRGLKQNPNVLSFLVRNYKKSSPVTVTWKRPEIGWIKLNFDGSSDTSSKRASIGGVFRNHKAEFVLGYAESIGEAKSTTAEFSALRRGLELALENKWSNVWLEGDAETLIEFIKNRSRVKCKECQNHATRIKKIIMGLNCVASHIPRKGNRTADKLARIGISSESPKVWIGQPPPEILRFLLEDAHGKILDR